jgi:hypothetical protein
MSFDVEDLQERGFSGFIPVRDLDSEPRVVPTTRGVYNVVRPTADRQRFLDLNPGSWFKGNDPTVSTTDLEKEWVPGAETLYIGSGANLRDRIGLLAEFSRAGRSRSVFHYGGRLLWQLADGQDLLVAWRAEPSGIGSTERDLVIEFKEIYGRYPFANLRMPPVRKDD